MVPVRHFLFMRLIEILPGAFAIAKSGRISPGERVKCFPAVLSFISGIFYAEKRLFLPGGYVADNTLTPVRNIIRKSEKISLQNLGLS